MPAKPNIPALREKYAGFHWGKNPTKVIEIGDPLIPNTGIVEIGELRQLTVPTGVLDLPKGCWVAFDPNHPHERIHLILTPEYREKVRQEMKQARNVMPIQRIAAQAGGTHVRYPLPNVNGTTIGVCTNILYWTHKIGDPPSLYDHAFGEQWSKGVKPILAADVSGRLWLCGGCYKCPDAGVSG